MSVLSWGKPAKTMTTEQWMNIQADSAPPGVYTPNMSSEDAARWRAKKIGGSDPRVEVRKTISGQGSYAQLVIIVRPDTTTMSMNGKAVMTTAEAAELTEAIREATYALHDEGR